ncbi:MAG TPA: nucleotidyltransferase [Solirubrobacteraceae bacterium]|nr:nucleotidyltransferase [Solirubrobacteraceae bacterium]
MSEALDPLPLLRLLHEQDVEHVIIGGFAVNAHGFIRVTKDLDIVPCATVENLRRLAGALRDLDAKVLETEDFEADELPIDPLRIDDLAQGGNVCLYTRLGRLDIMQWISGIDVDDLYAELEPQALIGDLDGVTVRVCGLEHLRTMKSAAGRPQDIEDLERLSEN